MQDSFTEFFTNTTLNDASTTNFGTVTPDLSTGTQTPVPSSEFVTLEAGVTKFRVYMWVEGQDVDCEDHASGTDIMYNVQFTIKQQS